MTSPTPGRPGLPEVLVGVPALAVVAHPDDETFGLGAVLSALADTGSEVRVLCLTAGEASTLGAVDGLAGIRRAELAAAAAHLGLGDVHLDDFPDGGLGAVAPDVLDEAVDHHVGRAGVLVTFEAGGVTGHPDHRAAAAAAARVAARRGLLLAEWGVAPAVAAGLRQELSVLFTAIDGPDVVEIAVDRARQRGAIACHRSQSTGNAVLTRRLDLQGNTERLRIRRPGAV